MLEVLGRNYSRNIESVRAFEIGNTFMQNLMDPEGLPIESDAMSVGIYGKDNDFFTLKGMITELLSKLGVRDVEFTAEREYGTYHPGRCARILTREKVTGRNPEEAEWVELGIMGEFHPDVTEKYGIGTRCCGAELMLNVITEMADMEKVYYPLPKYPATSRDIALVVDEEMTVGEIQKVIRKAGGKLLKKIELFDVYRGAQVGEGKKSVSFTVSLRASDRTLTDTEADNAVKKILKSIEHELGVTLRS